MEPWEIMISESQERMIAAVRPELLAEVARGDRALGASLGGDRRGHGLGRAARASRRRASGPDPRRTFSPTSARATRSSGGRGAVNGGPVRAPEIRLHRSPLGLRAVRPSRRLAHRSPPRARRGRAPSDAVVSRARRLARRTAGRRARPVSRRRARRARRGTQRRVRRRRAARAHRLPQLRQPREARDRAGSSREAIEGIAQAAEALGIPVVSGNVSLYNETDGRAIPPTPVVGCVGLVPDVRRVPRGWREGDAVFVVPSARDARPRGRGRARLVPLAGRAALLARPRRLGRRTSNGALVEAARWSGIGAEVDVPRTGARSSPAGRRGRAARRLELVRIGVVGGTAPL